MSYPPGAQPGIRTVIVTDVRLYREGLVMILGGERDLVLIASAAPCDADHAHLAHWVPDVVLADSVTIRGSSLIVDLAGAVPAARVVAFAVQDAAKEEVIACAEAGVAGFVARDASAAELVAVIRSAVAGEVRCSPRVTALLMEQLALARGLHGSPDQQRHLTRREQEIVSLIDAGLSNKEIAHRIGVETATVKNHVHSILEKLCVRSRGEAARLARTLRRWTPPAKI